jgi:hypothetical protein
LEFAYLKMFGTNLEVVVIGEFLSIPLKVLVNKVKYIAYYDFIIK